MLRETAARSIIETVLPEPQEDVDERDEFDPGIDFRGLSH